MKPIFFPYCVDSTVVGSRALTGIAIAKNRCILNGLVVATMPPATQNSGQLCLFQTEPSRNIDFLVTRAQNYDCDKLADPHTLISFYRDNLDFVDHCPVMTRWTGPDHQDCTAHFDRWRGKRRIGIGFGSLYSNRWWIAAIVRN